MRLPPLLLQPEPTVSFCPLRVRAILPPSALSGLIMPYPTRQGGKGSILPPPPTAVLPVPRQHLPPLPAGRPFLPFHFPAHSLPFPPRARLSCLSWVVIQCP